MIRWYNDIIYNIDSAVVIFVVVESSRCSSKTLQKGSCPYAPLDEALRYANFKVFKVSPSSNTIEQTKTFSMIPHSLHNKKYF